MVAARRMDERSAALARESEQIYVQVAKRPASAALLNRDDSAKAVATTFRALVHGQVCGDFSVRLRLGEASVASAARLCEGSEPCTKLLERLQRDRSTTTVRAVTYLHLACSSNLYFLNFDLPLH